jgi:hypothetical protein
MKTATRLFVSVFFLFAVTARPAGQATTSTTSTTVALNSPVGSSCSPELVDVTGMVHVVQHTTQSGQGLVSQIVQLNASGIGVGQISGQTYVFTQSSHQVFNSQTPRLEFTLVETIHLMRTGEAPRRDDFRLRAVVHVTINENGQMTATVESFDRACS